VDNKMPVDPLQELPEKAGWKVCVLKQIAKMMEIPKQSL